MQKAPCQSAGGFFCGRIRARKRRSTASRRYGRCRWGRVFGRCGSGAAYEAEARLRALRFRRVRGVVRSHDAPWRMGFGPFEAGPPDGVCRLGAVPLDASRSLSGREGPEAPRRLGADRPGGDGSGCPLDAAELWWGWFSTTVMGRFVNCSMLRRKARSDASQNESAIPPAPALAVRPTRWT